MQLNRRTFVGGAVALAGSLAGCSALDSVDNDSSGGGLGGGMETVVDDTEVVEEDQYLSYDFDFDSDRTMEYEFIVRDGPNIDVFVAETEEYNHYTQGEAFEYYGDSLDTSTATETIDLAAGEYKIVLDNTDYVEAQPPTNFDGDPAEVDITVRVE